MSPKRLKFINEYLIDSNATQAAIRSGFSEKTAYSQGQRLLKNVEVAKKIAELQEQARKHSEISREEVLGVLAGIIRANIPDYLKEDGKLKSFDSLSKAEKKAIESVKVGKRGVITVKLSSKLQAVNILNKMLGYESAQAMNIRLENMDESVLDAMIERLMTPKK